MNEWCANGHILVTNCHSCQSKSPSTERNTILCACRDGLPNINTIIKKAQQRIFFLRQLWKYNLPQELLIMFYTAVIESVLCTSITVWFVSATKLDKNRLQRTVSSAENIIGADLPTIQDLYTSRVRKRAGKITADPSHPGHDLFQLLPSGMRYRTLYTKTTRHRNSLFPLAVTLMNS